MKCYFVIVVYGVNRKSSANVCPKLNYMFEIISSHLLVNPDTACMDAWHVQFLMPYYMGIVCYFLFPVSRTASSTHISFPCREWSCHGSEVIKVSSIVQSAKVLRELIQTTEILRWKKFFRVRSVLFRSVPWISPHLFPSGRINKIIQLWFTTEWVQTFGRASTPL